MIPYKQLIDHDPENGKYGDCGRTAIACLLDMKPENVPHFWGNNSDKIGVMGHKACNNWLSKHGYAIFCIPYKDTSLQQLLDTQAHFNPGIYYMVIGTSKLGCNHVVICKGNEIVHDPSKVNSGIVGPCSDGTYWIELLVKL